MNQNILNIIINNQEQFIPLIFTKKQIKVLKKYKEKKKLTNAEKKALYTSITKKVKALELIKIEKENEFYINGRNKIIPERLEKAKELIKLYSKKYNKVFISGSFLFSKKYNDIDIFIIRERKYDEKWKNKEHIIFLTEKRLQNPVFQSAALISVSNFIIPNKITKKSLKLGDLMSSYHESAIEIIENQDRSMTRFIIFSYGLHLKNKIIDGSELKDRINNLNLGELDSMVKEMLKKFFSSSYLYVELHDYIKTLNKTIKTEKNIEHLKRYKSVYEEIINETRNSKAETA
jgi:hypothetical protein